MTVYLSNRDGLGKTNEEGHLRLLSKVLEGEVLSSNDLKVTQNSPLGLSVLVSAGDYRLETSGGRYAYMGWIDASTPVALTSSDVSNPRITSVVLYVDKSATTSPAPPNNPGIAKLLAVNGVPSSTPTAPSGSTIQTAVGTGNPYMVLADIRVGAAATQVTNSDITDLRDEIKLDSNILSPDSILQAVGPLLYPIGSIYTNATDDTNPSTLLGFGTWSRFGQGRVLVSQDSADTDFGGIGATGGSKRETLTESQMPSHSHPVDPPSTATSTGGNHTHGLPGDPVFTSGSGTQRTYLSGGSGQQLRWSVGGVQAAGSHNHSVDIPAFDSGSKGNGQSHNNLQPYVTVYVWRRTA